MIRRLSGIFKDAGAVRQRTTVSAGSHATRPEVLTSPVTEAGVVGGGSPTSLSSDVSVFHDCELKEWACRQVALGNGPAFKLCIDVFRFRGSYFSLVWDLPETMAAAADTRSVVRFEVDIASESPQDLYLRLNLEHGPNQSAVLRQLDRSRDAQSVEFDLAYADLSDKPISRMWVDILFGAPEMNRFELNDISVTNRSRAQL